MKITNFKFVKIVKSKDDKGFTETFVYGTVDVTTTTGFWFNRKTLVETRSVFRKDGICWRFQDTGRFTPDFVVEGLYEAHRAKVVLEEAY